MRATLTLLLFAVGFGSYAQQMEIQLGGMITFDQSAFTIQNAGSDFAPNIESEASFFVSITSGDEWDKKTNPNRKWKIEVRKEDLNWDNNIQLEIIRAGNGISQQNNNSNHVQNGNSYQTVREMPSYFFNGKGFVSDIPIQVRLSGFSIVNGANDYETNVILTIYDD